MLDNIIVIANYNKTEIARIVAVYKSLWSKMDEADNAEQAIDLINKNNPSLIIAESNLYLELVNKYKYSSLIHKHIVVCNANAQEINMLLKQGIRILLTHNSFATDFSFAMTALNINTTFFSDDIKEIYLQYSLNI
jgi:hypothetical protein